MQKVDELGINFIVCPKILIQHVCAILNKNTHTCEGRAIEIDEKENFPDNFVNTLSFFTWKN